MSICTKKVVGILIMRLLFLMFMSSNDGLNGVVTWVGCDVSVDSAGVPTSQLALPYIERQIYGQQYLHLLLMSRMGRALKSCLSLIDTPDGSQRMTEESWQSYPV